MLRTQNAALRSQLEQLQAQLVARPPTATGPGQNVSPTREPSAPSVMIPGNVASAPAYNPRPAPVISTTNRVGNSAASTGRTRTHAVKPGETATSIARQYSIKPGALLSANPGLDPRRMRIGQVLNIPVP
jgi:LysM repeat protein